MSAKFTPGPWASSGSFYEQGDPLFVCSIPSQEAAQPWVICRISNEVSKRPLDPEDFANAALIAAAPDLLDALIELERFAEEPALKAKARAAILKATGEAQ